MKLLKGIRIHKRKENMLNVAFVMSTIFFLIDDLFDISTILQTINSIEPHIQFNFMLENCNKIAFLDVLVTRWDSFFSNLVFIENPFGLLSTLKSSC